MWRARTLLRVCGGFGLDSGAAMGNQGPAIKAGLTYLTQPFERGMLDGSIVEVSAGGEVQQTL